MNSLTYIRFDFDFIEANAVIVIAEFNMNLLRHQLLCSTEINRFLIMISVKEPIGHNKLH